MVVRVKSVAHWDSAGRGHDVYYGVRTQASIKFLRCSCAEYGGSCLFTGNSGRSLTEIKDALRGSIGRLHQSYWCRPRWRCRTNCLIVRSLNPLIKSVLTS